MYPESAFPATYAYVVTHILRLTGRKLAFALTLLMAVAAASTTLPAAETVFSEGFEGTFPGSAWTVGDANPGGPDAFWGAVDSAFGGEAPHTGDFKGYCAAIGHGNSSANPTYRNQMRAFMRHSIDLTGVSSANLSFWYKAPTLESRVDLCNVFIDDTAVWTISTAAPVWTEVKVNLTPYVGQTRSLSFEFASDSSFVLEGVYLDDILVTTGTPPPNDPFTSPRAIIGAAGALVDSTVNATKESEEPDHAGKAGGSSTWFQWTAAAAGSVIIDTLGSDFDTVLAIYTGDNLADVSEVAANDNFTPDTPQSRVSFNASAGRVYRIAVDGVDAASGSVVLRWTQGVLPDLIISPPAVTPRIVERTLSADLCEVIEGCALPGTRRYLRFDTETRNVGAGDLFVGDPSRNPLFHYAPCHGHYHFDAFANYRLTKDDAVVVAGTKIGFCIVDGSRWDPNAEFFPRYNCNFQGLQAGWADNYRSDLPCQYIDVTDVEPGNYTLELEIDPGDFFIEGDEDNNVTRLPITILPSCTSLPANDAFSSPEPLPGPAVSTTGVNFCATRETGEADHGGNAGGHSLWYSWTATATEPATITTEGTDFDTVLGVYVGETLSTLTLVGQNNDISPSNRQSSVSFEAVQDRNYRIAVDGNAGAVGEIQLNINPPANNHLEDCQSIAGPGGQVSGHTIGATTEAEEPAHGFPIGRHSVWYCWTAPVSGPVEFYTDETSFETLLAVYSSGHHFHDLVSVALGLTSGAPPVRRARFTASAGEEYNIAVDGSDGAWGEFTLNWAMPARLEAVRTPAGDLQLILHGAPGMEHRIQSSNRLGGWNHLTTATIGEDGTATVDLGPFPPETQTFFRAVWP